MVKDAAEPFDSTIYDWADIADQFKSADILLGNGFSINLFEGFTYSILFSSFLNSLTDQKKDLYKCFETVNFESILKDLGMVKEVNSKLNIDETKVSEAIEELRSGLILVITNGHPKPELIVQDRIKQIEVSLRQFDAIFTLN